MSTILLRLYGFIVADGFADSFFGFDEGLHWFVLVEGVDDGSDVAVHVYAVIVFFFEELFFLVDKVGGENSVKEALFVGFVKLGKTVSEKSKG